MHRFLPATLAAAILITPALADPPAADVPPLLSGPKVAPDREQKSLVKHDMSDKLERIDTRPELAAINLLTLTPEQRSVVDELFAARAADVSAALRANMDLFLQIQGARQSGDLAGSRPLMRQLRERVPSLINPPLAQQVAEVLPEASRKEYTQLVAEYAQALAAEESATRDSAAGSAGSDQRMRRPNTARAGASAGPAAAERYELTQLVREMARTLSSIVSERRERTEALIAAVEATPEQQAQIEAILRQSAEQSRTTDKSGAAKPSAEERAQSIGKIMAILTPEQQKKLRDFLRKP